MVVMYDVVVGGGKSWRWVLEGGERRAESGAGASGRKGRGGGKRRRKVGVDCVVCCLLTLFFWCVLC